MAAVLRKRNLVALKVEEYILNRFMKFILVNRRNREVILQRNKRKGLRLRVVINNDPSIPSSYCERCYFRCDNYCLNPCDKFKEVVGTFRFYFRRDEDFY